MSRADQWLVTVQIDGVKLGPFDKLSGGDVTANTTKYRPGGMVPEVSLGGVSSVGDVTVSRLYDYDRDHTLGRRLASRVGKASMRVAKMPLDADGNPKGTPQVYTGILNSVNYPDVDSTSNNANMLELVCSTVGTIA